VKILVLNSGSSSLKYQLFDMTDESVLAKGLVERIGLDGSVLIHKPANKEKQEIRTSIPDHAVAIELVIKALTDADYGVISNMKEINAVGHRAVHGGSTFAQSTLIDEKVIAEIEKLVILAPLHNPPGLLGIEACKKIMPDIPQVAVFDTAFHQTIPDYAYIYPLPYEMYTKHGIRRYGFHGTSHRYVAYRVAQLMNRPMDELKIITCHLGNGSSITAINKGKVVDTSMGLTPLEGMIMGTRCGNIDPAIIPFILKQENISLEQLNNMINKESGFLGVSGVSSDLRNVEEAAAQGNERAQLSINIFHHEIIKFIGSYAAVLNGVDVIVFTAGIGENSKETRATVCKHLTYLGVEFDEEANNVRGEEREITKPGSKVKVFVIPTNEELMIARDTARLIE
jgi:acetate kinase